MPEELSEQQRLLLEHLKGIIHEGARPVLLIDWHKTRRLAQLIRSPKNKLIDVIARYAEKKQKLSKLYMDLDRLWNFSMGNRTFSPVENIYMQSRIERVAAALVKAKIESFEKLGVKTPASLKAEFRGLIEQVKKLNQEVMELREKKTRKKTKKRPRKRPPGKP